MADEELPSYTPQNLDDILPIYQPDSNSTSLESYTLCQVTPTNQALYPKNRDSEAPSYHIKTFATGGFLNKKPHIIFTRSSPSLIQQSTNNEPATPHASERRRKSFFRRSASPPSYSSTSKSSISTPSVEARFDIHGTGTTITYLTTANNASNDTVTGDAAENDTNAESTQCYRPATAQSIGQRLELYSASAQTIRTTIGRDIHYWQPHPGNKEVLELVDEGEEIVARFTYQPSSNPVSRQNTSTSAADGASKERKKSTAFTESDLGTLELVTEKIPNEHAREEVLCSCVTVVERARRRAINIGYATGKQVMYGSPMTGYA